MLWLNSASALTFELQDTHVSHQSTHTPTRHTNAHYRAGLGVQICALHHPVYRYRQQGVLSGVVDGHARHQPSVWSPHRFLPRFVVERADFAVLLSKRTQSATALTKRHMLATNLIGSNNEGEDGME